VGRQASPRAGARGGGGLNRLRPIKIAVSQVASSSSEGGAVLLKKKESMKQTDTTTISRAIRAAKEMYPDADVRVRRERVIVFDGDLIRLISYESDRGRPQTTQNAV
jgi:hypothetical protein